MFDILNHISVAVLVFLVFSLMTVHGILNDELRCDNYTRAIATALGVISITIAFMAVVEGFAWPIWYLFIR